MWDRKVLKARGKRAFKANYWRCVLVAFILVLVAGAGTGMSGFGTTGSFRDSGNSSTLQEESWYNDNPYDNDVEDILDNYDYDDDELGDINNPPIIADDFRAGLNGAFFAAGIIFLLVLILLAIGILLTIFLFNPLHVGCRRFFLINSDNKDAADVGDVGFAFGANYGNIAKTMFFKDLWIFLWSLLLIVPGIIKIYEYRMVPYLLAENPDMDTNVVLKTSTEMMYGKKWDSFVLDFSFFAWIALSICTLGILGIFYVDPYVAATDAELYKAVSGKRSGYADDADIAAEASELAENMISAEKELNKDNASKVPEDDVIVIFEESDGGVYIDDLYD